MQRLRDHEERTRLALKFAGAGTWEYLIPTGEMIWSPETFALYERDLALPAPRRREWAALVHPDDLPRIEAEHVAALSGGGINSEFRIRRADGGWRWVASRAQVTFDAAGAPQRVIGINIDLSQRKAEEAAQKRLTARWKTAVDAWGSTVWTNTPEGRMEGEQPGWAALTGQSFDAYQGYGWADAVHPDDAQRSIDTWNAAVATCSAFRLEHRVRVASGEWRWFAARAMPVMGETGEIVEWVGNHVEIHEQREASRLLAGRVAAATAERDEAWNNSRDILLILDHDGVVLAANPAWTATLGRPVADVIGKNFLEFLVPDDVPASRAALAVAATEPLSAFVNRYCHLDGTERTLSWATNPSGNSIFASGRDITEERRRDAELERTRAQVHEMQKLETIGQLTGGVAHDFNNLLTPIIGSLDLLQRKFGDGDARTMRLIDGALTAADRAKTLVQRLLAFARRQQLQTRAVDLVALVNGMRELIERSIGPTIAVNIVHEPLLPSVIADPVQLELALLNLAVNARDAMENGGTLTIAMARGSVTGRGRLRAGDYVRLAVVDTGTGMDEETLRRSVEPFFSTKGVGRGTGLGLSMVHGLAAQFGGRLTLASAPGAGTRAELWLPATDAAAPLAGDARPPLDIIQRRERVLLVDDEAIVRETAADLLADLGLEVVEATGPAEALALLDNGERFDALVTDYLMPGMNGGELVAAAQQRQPGLPALVVSGYSDMDAVPPSLARLAKPFRQAELARALAGLLQAKA